MFHAGSLSLTTSAVTRLESPLQSVRHELPAEGTACGWHAQAAILILGHYRTNHDIASQERQLSKACHLRSVNSHMQENGCRKSFTWKSQCSGVLVPVTPTFKQSFEFKEKMQLLNHLCYKQGSECS